MQYRIENMTCGGCARAITAAIRELDPNARVEADPPNRTVRIETLRPEPAVRAVLVEAGFPPA